MIARILDAEEYHLKSSGKECVRLKVEVDNGIAWIFLAPQAVELFRKFFQWCNVPIINKQASQLYSANLGRLREKLIPVEITDFQNRKMWQLNNQQILRGNK